MWFFYRSEENVTRTSFITVSQLKILGQSFREAYVIMLSTMLCFGVLYFVRLTNPHIFVTFFGWTVGQNNIGHHPSTATMLFNNTNLITCHSLIRISLIKINDFIIRFKHLALITRLLLRVLDWTKQPLLDSV